MHRGYVPKVDTDALMAASNLGLAAIRAGFEEKRAFAKEAKLSCDHCKKQETSGSPLQSCSRCRYCSRDCQVAHYKIIHKKACANFDDPPLCRSFNSKVILPGCSYPEVPIFGIGVSEGMGAWVSIGGSIDCRLATLPRGMRARPEDQTPSMGLLMAMTPGMTNGKYLALTIMVQNRSPKANPMVVIGKGIAAVASTRGTPIILQGKEPGEPSIMLDTYPHLGPVLGLAKASAELTHFNGKLVSKNFNGPGYPPNFKPQIKDPASCPAVKEASMCAVLLNVGEYAKFNIEFRAGGPNVTHDFQALELLAHVIVPAIPYDPKTTESYTELLPRAADKGEVCEIRALIDQDAVDAWYTDFKTKGERGYITSHYGEARANMVGEGVQAMAEMFKGLMGRMGG
ncbi:hypothetical protein DFH07DRAFT_739637 [Mycena maculata]|uniref:MYND-type domain-containing protein n=1 Tax=Mycena maculata TaxID=230809 RepID=A0AAD7NI33_9AGAR|nr:hypothetical protein DFH07DRAFT_739637 [Mycena maculata]